MKGFTIKSLSEKGDECLLQDINANKKAFNMTLVKEKPFLEMDFTFSKRPTGRMIQKMMNLAPVDDALKHVKSKFSDLGAVDGEDYEVSVIV